MFEVGIKIYSSVGFALKVSSEQIIMLTDRKAEERKKGGKIYVEDRKAATKK